MLEGTVVPSCGGGRVTAIPSERPNTQCCGKRAGAHSRREPKEKTWLLDPSPAFLEPQRVLLTCCLCGWAWCGLSFSQGSPCFQPSWETCREGVRHCLCWAWRTAKGGKGIFILDKNDPEVMQSACPNPLFSELRLWRFILSFISADCLFEIGRLLVRSVCLLGRFILAAVDSLKVCVFSSLSHCLTLSLVSG